MKISEIKRLDNKSTAQENAYGKKIGVLSKLLTNGVNVPCGFYFTIESKHGNKLSFIAKIREFCTFNDDTPCFIVRSSMSLEDNVSHQFPGIFLSVKNVKSEDALIEAIDECIKSKDSESALRYANNLGIPTKDLTISILVQQQIDIQYFGLAEIKHDDENFVTVEITKKDSFELVHGQVTPSAIRIYRESNFDILSNSENIDFLKINISQINKELTKIRQILNFDVIVEFGITENGVYVFQAREHEIKGKNPLRGYIPEKEKVELSDEKKEIFPNEKKWGLKGAAMEYFRDNNLFEEPLLLIENGESLIKIRRMLNENNFCNGPITLRFSKGDDIGLKRFFVSDRDSAYRILANYFPDFQKLKQLLIIRGCSKRQLVKKKN